MSTKQTHIARTLQLLERRGPKGVNSLEAIDYVGTPRVAARVKDLKDEGYRIDATYERWHGSPSKRYVLVGGPHE